MKVGHQTDFTTGNIPKQLITFSIPMLLGNILQTLYTTVDSIWVGRFLGPEALGAVSVSNPVAFVIIAFVLGLGMAVNIMVAQYLGAKKHLELKNTIGTSLTLFTLIGAILTVIGLIFHQDILEIIQTPETILPLASSYLYIYFWGLIFVFLYNTIGGILRGLGDSKTPLLLLVYSTIINIILDPFLIIGIPPFPKMGVAGASLATIVAQAFSGLLGIFYIYRMNLFHFTRDFLSPKIELIKVMLKIGLPAGAQQTFVSLGFLVLTAFVNGFGDKVVAAYGAAGRTDNFSFLPAMTFSLAISSMAGQNLGARDITRAKEVARWGATISVLFAIPISIFVYLFADTLLRIFTTDSEVIRIGVSYLRIIAFTYIPFSAMFAYNGFLRGAGDTMQTMINTLLSLWVIRIPVAKILSMNHLLGINGVWIGFAIGPIAGFLLAYGYFRTGKWKNKIIVNSFYRNENL
jgi:putative MATE family efflux protein